MFSRKITFLAVLLVCQIIITTASSTNLDTSMVGVSLGDKYCLEVTKSEVTGFYNDVEYLQEDSCIDDDRLTEFYCDTDSSGEPIFSPREYICPSDGTCVAGACIVDTDVNIPSNMMVDGGFELGKKSFRSSRMPVS